jgi:hypothetical protein
MQTPAPILDFFLGHGVQDIAELLNLLVGIVVRRTALESIQFLIIEILDGLGGSFHHALLFTFVVLSVACGTRIDLDNRRFLMIPVGDDCVKRGKDTECYQG